MRDGCSDGQRKEKAFANKSPSGKGGSHKVVGVGVGVGIGPCKFNLIDIHLILRNLLPFRLLP